jgi:hypothetical protein
MNKFLKSALRTAVYFLDQSANQVDRLSSNVSDLAEQGRRIIDRNDDHTVRNVVNFALGLGVGIGAGILLAPASGQEIRTSINDRVQDIGEKVRERLSGPTTSRPTGTEAP